MSLPAHHRLRHRREFSKVYKHGLRRSSPHLTLRAFKIKPHADRIDAKDESPPQSHPPQSKVKHPDVDEETVRDESSHDESNNDQAIAIASGDRPVSYEIFSSPPAQARATRTSHPPAGDMTTAIIEEPPTRVGISISQKVSKKAVVRNRIKRQIKAAIRHLLPRIQNGWLLVIVVRPSAIQCDYWQFLRELEEMLRTTEVFDGHS